MVIALVQLCQEHRWVLQVLSAMEATVVAVRRGVAVDRAWLNDAARFHMLFTDGAHLAREEGVLFKALLEHGISRTRGPIRTMLEEHDAERSLVRHLSSSARDPSQEALDTWTSAALGYCQLMRSHIHKEESVLFPLAEAMLPPERLAHLDTEFAAILPPTDEDLAKTAEGLVTRARTWWPADTAGPD